MENTKTVRQNGSIGEYCQRLSTPDFIFGAPRPVTYAVTYPGRVYPKEIQGIVERMEMEPYVRAFSVFAYAKAEKLVLHIQQRFDHDGVAKRIEWEMKKLGLRADLEDRGYIYSDKVLVSSLT